MPQIAQATSRQHGRSITSKQEPGLSRGKSTLDGRKRPTRHSGSMELVSRWSIRRTQLLTRYQSDSRVRQKRNMVSTNYTDDRSKLIVPRMVISSTVIESIRAECAAQPGFACAYFFFDSRNAQTDLSLHHKLVRSIIKQLSHQSSGFPASLMDLYGGGHEQPSIASLQLTLQKIIDGFERVYIIVDAVDECADREKVLGWIERITRRKGGNLQVLLSSRPEHDIEDQLQSIVSLARVTLNNGLAEQDIKTSIDAKLSRMIRWDKATLARVKDALVIRSDGM